MIARPHGRAPVELALSGKSALSSTRKAGIGIAQGECDRYLNTKRCAAGSRLPRTALLSSDAASIENVIPFPP